MNKHKSLLVSSIALPLIAALLSSCSTGPTENQIRSTCSQQQGDAGRICYVPQASGILPAGYSKITLRRSTDAHLPLYIVDFDTSGFKADAIVDSDSELLTLTEGPEAPKKLNAGVNRTAEMLQQGGLAGSLGYGFGRMLATSGTPKQLPCKLIGLAPAGSVLAWNRPAGKLRLAAYSAKSDNMKVIVMDVQPGREYLIDYTPFTGAGAHQSKTLVSVK